MVNFLHVPEFPECRNTKTFLEPLGIDCPTCKGQIVMKDLKRVANFMAVVIIQIVILFPGSAYQRTLSRMWKHAIS